ncbi:MAG: PAS domain S-box protein [Gemmatimonadetes bacterium]|nr:PAS domain S-box protein [Gemmatimonadota bacterium]
MPATLFEARTAGEGGKGAGKREPRWIRAFVCPVRYAGGDVREVMIIHWDVTDEKRAEAALRASEESYRTIFELAGDAIFVHDPETGAVLDANRKACELHGVTLEELRAVGVAGVSAGDPAETGPEARALVRRAAAGEPQLFEWQGRHTPTGEPVWVEVSLERVTIRGEARVLAIVRNVTERKLAEQALQEAYAELERRVEERTEELAVANRALESEIAEHRAARARLQQQTAELEALFQALPDVYLRIREDGIIVDHRFGSDAELYPIPDGFPSILVGARVADYMPGELGALLEGGIVAVRRSGQIATYEYPLPVGGEERHFETRVAPMPDDTAICVIRDITERKRSEAALALAKEEAERAREAAERANRAKSEFLSRMSHELRTPMNSILGFAQLLGRAELPPHHVKSVQHILKAGRHLLQLINEVLEIARIEAGRHPLSLEPVRVRTVVEEAIGLVRPLAAQLHVQLEAGPEPAGDVYVRADRQRLAQVLLNLLSNAIKYNRPGGRVRLTCALEGEAVDPLMAGAGAVGAAEAVRLVVRVEDTGPGIPADRVAQLFTPFSRLGAEQSDVEGTGLGLALSQRLTEAMGGSLELERTGPEGSVFRLALDVAESPLGRLDEPAERAGAGGEVPHRPATLLYIEDNLANLSLVETILLSRPRWRTIPALQGRVGLELAREHAPDLVLLDLHLPDVPGEEVLRRLRAEARTATIPVVIISADATRATVERLQAAGVAGFLTKPLDVDEFLGTLDRLLLGTAEAG